MDDYEKDIKCNDELVRDFENTYYKNKIPQRLFNAMIEYQIDIDD